MNSQHLIDSAIFDTTYTREVVALDRQPVIDEFVKTHLMTVVDEVFDRVATEFGNADFVFRIDNLEIDLGKIPCSDFRQQMPKKLREQLMLALSKIRYSARSVPTAVPGVLDSGSAEREQLFYFLRNGHLPWYSRLSGGEALEALLIETIDSEPARLIEFLESNSRRTWITERLLKQFSKQAVQRFIRSLQSMQPRGLLNETKAGLTADADSLPTPLVAAILSQDTELVGSIWRTLYAENTQLLERILRYFGQRAIVRQGIVVSFTPALFDELLRLLEPGTHGFMQSLFENVEVFQVDDRHRTPDRARQTIRLREFTLSYLLLERGSRFSKESYLTSLLGQMAASSMQSQAGLLLRLRENMASQNSSNRFVRELARLLENQASELGARAAGNEESPDEIATEAAGFEQLSDEVASQAAGFEALSSGKEAHKIDPETRYECLESVPLPERIDGQNQDSSLREDMIDPEARYERLESVLLSEGIDRQYQDSTLLEDIRALEHEAPGLLMRWFKELPGASRTRDSILGKFSLPVLTELTHAILSSRSQLHAADASASSAGLLAAIHENAEKAENRKAFYIQILGRLISGEVIDFEVLGADERAGAESPGTHGDLSGPGGRIDRIADDIQSYSVNRDSDALDPPPVQSDEQLPVEDIYIANAGIVLAAAYLPRLFERLNFIDEGRFKDRESAERGVHCVQYLVNESVSSPEYQLVLNKLLCGVKPGLPIRRSIELASSEKEQLEALLHAITRHWKALANTSITGLRESFLQRNGRLQLKNDAWNLSVESRPFDMLLDQVPWTFTTIMFPWMERVIYVEWR